MIAVTGSGPLVKPTHALRRSVRCLAVTDEIDQNTKSTPPQGKDSTGGLPKPEWLPEQGAVVLDFLNAQDFDIKQWGPYKQYIEKYATDETYSLCYGWKELPEIINGRLAMLGFVAAASAELLGGGPVLYQLAVGPQAVLSVLVLFTAASIIPVIKGVKGDYLHSLFETYTLPEDVFTPDLERVHSRLAMVGMFGLILVEMLKGSAVL